MIDIAIIGGGPAGLSAGLYAARGGTRAVLFEELYIGGQAAKTLEIENYPGFEEGVRGHALMESMQRQSLRFGLEITCGEIETLSLTDEHKTIRLRDGDVIARAVILAMGASPKKLPLPRADELTGRGVSYCATCDGAFYRNRDVAVVGGGDTALSDALYLARFAKNVYMIHRRNTFRGTVALQNAVRKTPNINILLNSTIEALQGGDNLQGLRIHNKDNGKTSALAVDGLFTAIGITPNAALAAGQVRCNEGGYIITDARMQTSAKGVYAAGDVRDTPLRQVVTAVSDGAIAATSALKYLNSAATHVS
ncbi:MAG: thioredoxin-disulfide reductase [Clostridiales bacterium]|jgi:thioredoxin reductase (NADPH)|nr:thioredoxin-disulfide reductase [Clostridiales bacterium]